MLAQHRAMQKGFGVVLSSCHKEGFVDWRFALVGINSLLALGEVGMVVHTSDHLSLIRFPLRFGIGLGTYSSFVRGLRKVAERGCEHNPAGQISLALLRCENDCCTQLS
jgi:hypothetical protein